MAQSVLAEIGERLTALADGGETAAIDLLSLPMTPADRAELKALLGRGEIEAVLDIAGPSQIWETAYSGVWWVRHFGAGSKIAVERIEITALPDILKSADDDIAAAATRLRSDLNETAERETEPHV
jgi:hydrogenase-1 operon protein HyaF